MKVGDLVIRKVNYGDDKGYGLIVNTQKSEHGGKIYFGVKFSNNDDLFYYDVDELVVINESR